MINIGIQIGNKLSKGRDSKGYTVIKSVMAFNGKPLSYFGKLIGVKHNKILSKEIKT